jgi:hypothetical protein
VDYTAPTTLVRAQQIEAWGYYGAYGVAEAASKMPKGTAVYGATRATEAVGEVRYIVGWAADQMSRMQWDVLVDGSTEWELELDDGTTVVSDGKTGQHPHGKASAKVLKHIGWNKSTVRLVTTNAYVAGELFYVKIKDKWRVVSVIHPLQSEIFKEADYVIRGLWPSPIDPDQPDAPLFGVLSILQDMDWLGRLSRAQSANRVGMRGILGSADGLNFAGGGDFWTEWDKALRAKMEDPTDVGPVHLRGALELVKPEASGRGMAGLSWVVPDFPYDARIEGRMESMIHRLSYGLPIPPEILMGLSAQSRATAFQVEENSYRAHIEPPANIVAQIATDVLNCLFEDVEIEVVPDPTLLLAKRQTVQDVKDAYDRGEVSGDYLREVLGIPGHAAPSPEERERRRGDVIGVDKEEGGHSPTTETPRQRAARADRDDDSGAPADQKALDPTLLAEWKGRIEVATFRARDRLGAKARTHKSLRDILPPQLSNDEVPAHLGLSALESAGVDAASVVSDSLLFLGPRSAAGDNLVDTLTEHVLATLDSASPVALGDAELGNLLQGIANRDG